MPDPLGPREMLEKLVGFDTVSAKSNLPLIHFVRDWLASHGVESTLVPDETGEKAALFAQVGPDVPGGVVLSGHTDVVPVADQAWSTDPFTLTERDGRLHGRGTCDMKGFDALALAIVPHALKAGLKRPLQIALSYDEEVGCLGAPPMIAKMREALPPASAVIVGEPTSMKTVSAHKGILGLETRVRGFEVHSSLCHTGVSAVAAAARLVAWLDARMAENAAASPASPDAAAYEPPYTTLHVGRFQGGTAHNITAGHAWFTTDIRVAPPDTTEDWLARYRAEADRLDRELKAIRPEAGVEIRVRAGVPGCRKEPAEIGGDGEAERLVRTLTGDNSENVVAYATEAGQFQEAGYSAVICGPGSIEQAHQPDEYVEIAQLEAGEAFMKRLVARLAS
ncbi:MAG TPA: acetylornithine deacetylase [Paracoccaceae bacterium]|nr:acetylornithine deacetylase [Paracoccaceae bacterium]